MTTATRARIRLERRAHDAHPRVRGVDARGPNGRGRASSARCGPAGRALVLAAALLLAAGGAVAESGMPRSPRPASAELYFITPSDGETLTSPVTVRFGLKGMGVAPAGVAKPETGHHHLVVDAELPPPDLPVPTSDHYRHFGKGQTETVVELAPGQHTLQLVLGDQNHVPHDPPLTSKRITITVKE